MNFLCRFYDNNSHVYDERWVQCPGGRKFITERWLRDNHRMYCFEVFDCIVRQS